MPRTRPVRLWRSHGDDALPAPAKALDQPFAASPSWFHRIEDVRCGKVAVHNEPHAAWHGCGGPPRKAELPTGVEDVSSPPMRQIVLGVA